MEIDGKQKVLAIASHVSYIFFGVGYVIVPLIIYLMFDKKDSFVAEHAKQALIAQVAFGIVSAIVGALTAIVIGILFWPLVILLGIIWFVCSCIGSYRALQGVSYHYPLLDRF